MSWGTYWFYYQCPDCGATLFRKKGRGGKTYCAREGCGYVKGVEDKDE